MKTMKEVRELIARGQEQVLRFWEELSPEEREVLQTQIAELDWEELSLWNSCQDLSGSGEITPLLGLRLAEIEAKKSEYFEIGKEVLRGGLVGAVLLAGGQGTRLGSSEPKGTYDIGITKPLYIFECLIQNLQEVNRACQTVVPLFIMTSEKNDAQTREFFQNHDFFGYPKEDIYFFRQAMSACVDLQGKILLETKGRIATSPNGNGGWYASMIRAGLQEVLNERKIEWLNVFAVDNVLQKIADPIFVGATVKSGKNCGAKTVAKATPKEGVGVLCLQDGKPNIIEYYELTEEMAHARDSSGELLFRDGVILNYLFSVPKLNEIVREKCPVHVVKKKIPYVADDGSVQKPKTENGYKFETLILDMVRLMDSCLSFEVVREAEFAPIKNKTGVDSVESAQELLRKNGVQL